MISLTVESDGTLMLHALGTGRRLT